MQLNTYIPQLINRYQPHQFAWLISASVCLVLLAKVYQSTDSPEEKSQRTILAGAAFMLSSILFVTRNIINRRTLGAVYGNLVENPYEPPHPDSRF